MAQQQDLVDEIMTDHREVEDAFAEIERDGAKRHRDLVDHVITELVRHSVAEEQYLYPTARRVELGEKFQNTKKIAPTHPHPSAPDKPPANKILGPGVGLIDRVRDAQSGRDSSGL